MIRKVQEMLLLLSLVFVGGTYAQQMIPETIPTPNATDLGKYGEIPISYYTGRPDISTPVYSMDMRGYEFPIYLSYDAGGVQPNSLPGWVGNNWTLIAGGAITRVSNHYDDETEPVIPSTVAPFSNYFSSYGKLKEEMKNPEQLKNDVEMHRYDFAPDVFHFNFMGKTGKFFLGNDGQWKVFSDENIDVIFDVNDRSNYITPFVSNIPDCAGDSPSRYKMPAVIKGFTLRDDKGYVYEFGGSNDAIEYTSGLFTLGDALHANSWYLTKISDKYGNMLYQLEYQRGCFIVQVYNIDGTLHVKEYYDPGGLMPDYGQEFFTSTTFRYDGTLNSPVYLERIVAADGSSVRFNSSYSSVPFRDIYPRLNIFDAYIDYDYSGFYPFWYLQTSYSEVAKYQYKDNTAANRAVPLNACRLKELNSINVYRFSSDETHARRVIRFKYDHAARTNLTDVITTGNDTNSVQSLKYHLEYNYMGKSSQGYLTKAVDHWGYYNGKTGNDSRQFLKADRSPSGTTAGMLSSITYPTGGRTVFQYEPHDYSAYLSTDRTKMVDSGSSAGGLRIKTITEYDGSNYNVINSRTFSYRKPGTGISSGELFAMPIYSWPNWYAELRYSGAYSMISMERSASIMPMSNSFGPHIGYSHVEETNHDGSKTVYDYSNISSSRDSRFILDFMRGEPSPFDRFTERGYKRGKLLSVHNYNKDQQLLRSVKFGYREGNIETDSVLTCNLRYVNMGSSATFSYFKGGVYKLLFPKYDVIADTTITYYGDKSVCDTKAYDKSDRTMDISYPYSHKQLVRTLGSVTSQRGNSLKRTDYQYAFDSTDAMVQSKAEKYFDLSPIGTKEYVNGQFTGGSMTEYRHDTDGTLVPDTEVRLNADGSSSWMVRYDEYTPLKSVKQYWQKGKGYTELEWWGNDVFLHSVTRKGEIWKGVSQKTEYYYNAPWQLEQIIYPNGYHVMYDYDTLDRLSEAKEIVGEEEWNGLLLKRYKYNYRPQ